MAAAKELPGQGRRGTGCRFGRKPRESSAGVKKLPDRGRGRRLPNWQANELCQNSHFPHFIFARFGGYIIRYAVAAVYDFRPLMKSQFIDNGI